MANKVEWKPAHLHTVTPYLTIKDAHKAIQFYKEAFGAEEMYHMDGPDGKLMHAEIKIGDSVVMISDECAEFNKLSPATRGGATASLMVYFNDVDKAFDRAVKAGCNVVMPLTNMFWGDRFGSLLDPFGQPWALSMHVEDVSMEEMKKRQEAQCKEMAATAKK